LKINGIRQFATLSLSIVIGVSGVNAKQIFIDHCAACHGEDARGIKDQGADLVTSLFVKRLSDAEMVEFLKMGRQPDSPDSTMKLLMPAFDYLTDEEIAQAMAFARNPK
jgi:mono/diheme cytochrome c family protein